MLAITPAHRTPKSFISNAYKKVGEGRKVAQPLLAVLQSRSTALLKLRAEDLRTLG